MYRSRYTGNLPHTDKFYSPYVEELKGLGEKMEKLIEVNRRFQ
jgi:hypothetical protein